MRRNEPGVLSLCLLLAAAPPAPAVDLVIQYAALQRILAQQMFTQDGRKYVRGNQTTKCSYAYLENPRIEAWNDRLHVQAHFSGRSARNFLGSCLGLGDAFDVSITAVPYYHDGLIGFRDVHVDSVGRDGFYIRLVRAAMTQSLSRDFQYHLMDDARRILEEPRAAAPYHQQLHDFRVPQVRVTPQGLLLTLEFGLVVQ